MNKIFFNKTFVLILVAGAIFRMAWFQTPLELDEGTYAYIAGKLLEGENPYIYTNNKLPLFYLNYLIPNLIKSFDFYRIYGLIFYFLNLILLIYLIFLLTKNKNRALTAGLIYTVLMNIPLLQGFLNKPSLFFIFYILISLILLVKKSFYLSSLFFSIAIFSNTIYLFYLGTFNFIIVFKKSKFSGVLKYSIIPFFLTLFQLLAMNLIFNINLLERTISSANDALFFINDLSTFHNFGFPILYFEALIPIIIILIMSFSKNKSFIQKSSLFFVSSLLVLFLFIPVYGHLILSLVPFVCIAGSKIKKKYVLFLLLFVVISSVKYYPNLNLNDSIKFHDFSSITEQKQIVKLIIEENKNFLYYGWNPGIYWLTKKSYPVNGSLIFKCVNHASFNDIKDKKALNTAFKKTKFELLFVPNYYLEEFSDSRCLIRNLINENFDITLIKNIGSTKVYELSYDRVEKK